MSVYSINLASKISTPVVGDFYRLKYVIAGIDQLFARFLHKADGSYSEDNSSGTTHDVDITSEMATALANPKHKDKITITGVTYVLNAPANRDIYFDGALNKYRCTQPLP